MSLAAEGAAAESKSGAEWFARGMQGGVPGLTRLQCFLRALEAGQEDTRATALTYYCVGQRMGRHGATNHVEIAGVETTRNECYTRSRELDPDTSSPRFWHSIGHCGGDQVQGEQLTEVQCFLRALAIDPSYPPVWNSLGIKLDGKTIEIAGESYSEKDCYVKALTADPLYSPSWRNLGLERGGVVEGRQYSKPECFVKAVEADIEYTSAWNSLGTSGGGKVNGVDYSAAECYARSIQMDPKHLHAWQNLASVGGGVVGGELFSQDQCESRAWLFRGRAGGKKVSGQDYEPRECYQQSVQKDCEHILAWEAYGQAGGGQVQGDPERDTFTGAQCFQRASELTWT